MKKIFTVSRVKNEGDIIESFCRYNLTYCDGMFIQENDSSDNTLEILQKLISEGLPIYLTQKGSYINKAEKAIDEYGADLIVPLDADEFLYHIDGKNPREILEELREDVEYQIPWRTYVYEKEPDIGLGFISNNFTHYRNPALEIAQGHAGKTLISKYLIKEKQAKFSVGAHWLVYPEEYQGSVKIENPEKLVCAHFPVRSHAQLLKKTIPNWITKWNVSSNFPYHLRKGMHQLGVLFDAFKKDGKISPDKMKKYSLEYSMRNPLSNLSESGLEKIKNELGNALLIKKPMDVSFCASKLKLQYSEYNKDSKAFLQTTLKEIDSTVGFLTSEVDNKAKQIDEFTLSITKTAVIYFDTGNGYDENEKECFSFSGNEAKISCQVPENTISVRLDPVEENGCIVSNLEILSYNGIVKYEPINGFMDKAGNLAFTNTDPRINLQGVAHWLKIKYEILLLSEFPHYKILENFIASCQECDGLIAERKELLAVRDELMAEKHTLVVKYPELAMQNCTLFFDTGSGYSNNERQEYSFIGNEVEIYCQIPENIVTVRLDPVEGYGCIISDLKGFSCNGIISFEPVNGFMDKSGDMVFVDIDPQIRLHGIAHWLKIKYRILFISEFSHYRVLNHYMAVSQEINNLMLVCNALTIERNGLAAQRDGLAAQRDDLAAERNGLAAEQENLVAERDSFINSRSWRITKPLREMGSFIERHRVLHLFAKGLLSIKRVGIKATLNEVKNYKKRKQLSAHEIKILFKDIMQPDKIKICIQVHIYYLDLLHEIIKNLNYIPFPFCCYISTDTDEKVKIIHDEFNKKLKSVSTYNVMKVTNRGRDVAPFLEQMRNCINNYEYILHIHTKKSTGNLEFGEEWRKYLFKYLLGSTKNINRIFHKFFTDKNLGIVYPVFSPVIPFMIWGGDIEQGKKNVFDFLRRIGIEISLNDKPEFPAGNMFWARTKSIQKVFHANINQHDFPYENNQQDMTLAHAIERSWVYVAKNEGYTFKVIK